MTALLSRRLRNALEANAGRVVIEDASGTWRLSGAELLGAATSIYDTLAPDSGRPLVAYLKKTPLYYAFTACAFLNNLDFCPLDTDNPVQRVIDVGAQLSNSLILCDSDDAFTQLRAHTESCANLAALVQTEFRSLSAWSRASVDRRGHYYIATSGSTGPPKLVEVSHAHTMPFIDWAIPFYEVDATTRWAQFSSIGFDLSLVDFLTVVAGGGVLVSVASNIDKIRPAKTVARAGITHWHSVPSMIPYFLRDTQNGDAASTCRLFTFCGEPLMKTDVDGLAARYPGARIVNTYGPTEGTLFCSFFEYTGVANIDEITLPIGEPIPSWNFVLLPDGDTFKLIIVSGNVSDGYAGVSSSQFATIDFFGKPVRAFDTGDYFRRVGTDLYFSHRRDGMVKIHGNRIDLGEIEAAAKRSGLVNPVAVVVENQIVLAVEGTPSDSADTISELGRYLPRASLPARIEYASAHPRNVNGKLDRRAIARALGAS